MSDPEGRPTVRELLEKVPGRVYPVGRLDFSTSGILLATNDGDFAAALLHPRQAVPKTYVVKTLGEMKDEDLDQWRKGIRLEDGVTLPARVKLLRHEDGKTWLELTITEGRNQQIRRMGDATGFRVMRLARTAFAGVSSEAVRPGAWRYLTHDELTALKKQFGVPKRVFSPPVEEAKAQRKAWTPGRRDDARGRPARGKPQGDGARPGARRSDPRAEPPGHPRYGGGAPARRDVGVRTDWGGGIRRGSSGSRDEESVPRADVGGRGGRTRTTGTSGGIGARDGDYRVRGRRRP
jgi:23S rRNA pseudouridine2605 synthase